MTKPRIGIFGRMNVGKSTLFNMLADKEMSIVSPQAGTTTDPVRRGVEILDFGPVIFIDTAGYDDRSVVGGQRVAKTSAIIDEVDLAILVVGDRLTQDDQEFVDTITCSYIILQRSDPGFKIVEGLQYLNAVTNREQNSESVSSVDEIFEAIKSSIPLSSLVEPPFYGGRITQGDVVILVCPIDSEAPSGRLILPQVQALRAALDQRAMAIVVQPSELAAILKITSPRLIVTDSQAFADVTPLVPVGVELTSFSILLSELKGDPVAYKHGIESIATLKDGDKILLIEHCSHQSSCDDIARVKIPKMIRQRLGLKLIYEVASRLDDMSDAQIVVQCGGCMVGRRAVMSNVSKAQKMGVPITNYGMLLRFLQSSSLPQK